MGWEDDALHEPDESSAAVQRRDSFAVPLGGRELALLDALALRTGLSRAQVLKVALLALARGGARGGARGVSR